MYFYYLVPPGMRKKVPDENSGKKGPFLQKKDAFSKKVLFTSRAAPSDILTSAALQHKPS